MKLWMYYRSRQIIFSLVVFTSFLFFFSCISSARKQPDSLKAQYYYDKQKIYPQGTIQEQKYLDKSIQADPSFTPALVEKSVSFNKRALYATGFQYLDKAVNINPERHLGYRGFVKLYMLRDYNGALCDLLRLDSLTPYFRDYPWGEDIFKVIGLCYLKLDDIDSAVKSFDKCINDVDEDWIDNRAYLYRGIVDIKSKNYESSIQYFDAILKNNRKNSEAYYYKAKAFLALHNIKKARILRDSALFYFDKGHIETSPYYEVPYQVYRSDIENLLNNYDE